MKRSALATGFVLLFAACAGGQNVRIEIGVGGVYPAGEWTPCRVSGLDNVPDGTVVTLRVSGQFEREFRVERGVAEGPIIIPDDSPTIGIEVPGAGRVRVPPEDIARLECVEGARPAVLMGGRSADNSVAPFIPPVRGSVRPDLYEIFGPPEWTFAAKRNVALAFAAVLVVAALASVFPMSGRRARIVPWIALAAAGVLACLAVSAWLGQLANEECVSIFETQGGASAGVLTTVVTRTHMNPSDAGRECFVADGGLTPAAAYRGEWTEHPIRVGLSGDAVRVPSRIPSRDVTWRWDVAAPPVAPEASSAVDARVRALRERTERWWRDTRRATAAEYSLSWLAPDATVFSGVDVGTLVAVRRSPAP